MLHSWASLAPHLTRRCCLPGLSLLDGTRRVAARMHAWYSMSVQSALISRLSRCLLSLMTLRAMSHAGFSCVRSCSWCLRFPACLSVPSVVRSYARFLSSPRYAVLVSLDCPFRMLVLHIACGYDVSHLLCLMTGRRIACSLCDSFICFRVFSLVWRAGVWLFFDWDRLCRSMSPLNFG